MKLAYFTNTYPRATDTFIRREVLGLRARGFDVYTYSVHKTGSAHDVDNEVISEKKNTHYLMPPNTIALLSAFLFHFFLRPASFWRALTCAYKTQRPGLKGSTLQVAYFLEALLLASRMRKDSIEHIHNHFGDNSGNVTLFCSLLSGVPFSISIHGPHIFFDALYWALDYKAKHATFISCIGHFCRSQLMLYTDKNDWHKFQIIRCGIDPEKITYREPKAEVKQLLYVGRLDAEKGVPVLLNSMAELKKQGLTLTLILVGDGADRQFLHDKVNTLDIASCVEFRGFLNQKEIAKEMENSDAFVLPSFAEGIPVSFMEAMAAGVPVIATNVGGVSELITHGETGLITHASDEHGLAEAIRHYAENPKQVQSISINARQKVCNEFSIEPQVDKLAQLFQKK